MAEKLSWTELRRALANRAGVSEKEANAFLSALNTGLIEALKTDKQVRINGLGTFKLQAVAPRKSVNVKTGEEITIAGYNKVIFSPESGVKELVEKNSAVSTKPATSKRTRTKAAVIDDIDPLKKLGEQAEEIVDLLADLGQSPNEPQPVPVIEEPKQEEQKPAEPEPVPVVEEPKPEEKPAEPEPIVEEKPKKPVFEVEIPNKRKKGHFLRDTIICVILLLALLAVGYFFMRNEISSMIRDLIKTDKEQTEMVEQPAQEQPATETKAEEPVVEESVEQEVTDKPVVPEEPELSYQKQKYEGIRMVEVKEGSRLAWVSMRQYKTKAYWPYLYDANRDLIKNPNVIQAGTMIRVPKLTAAQKDTTNAQTKVNLEYLRKEAEAAMK